MSEFRVKLVKALLICALLVVILAYAYHLNVIHHDTKSFLAQEQTNKQTGALPIDQQVLRQEVAMSPVETKCPMYQEFRRLNFQSPSIKQKLCQNALAYKRYSNGFPMCVLQDPFDEHLMSIVRHGSVAIQLQCIDRPPVQIFAYRNDHISNVIRGSGNWEGELVRRTLSFALKIPQTTFMDIGSNIGVYSIQAAKLGLPVVALDANIRNLLRLRLSLNAASLQATLAWNFITQDQNLKYLSFFADCNVGAAGRDKADLPDTVPVMPLRSERLASLIKTRNVVMKMDIQGGEADFFQTSGRLFSDFNVAAVQAEWYRPMIYGNESSIIAQFFISRGYKVWQIQPGFELLDPHNTKSWGDNIDVMWVRKDFVNLF